jgi:hypothetical protein
MSNNLFARSVHDLTAAAWFGGSLMGAVGLNGAAAHAKDPVERASLSTIGWMRWAPVQAAALGLHVAAGLALKMANKERELAQHGVARDSLIKAAVTLTGAGVTVYSGLLGRKVGKLAEEGAEGATEPSPTASAELAAAQKQLKYLQWAIPVFAGTTIVLGAKHGEMQRPENVFTGLLRRLSWS